MKVILQHDERDCGTACLAMIAAYYGLKLPLSEVRRITKNDSFGTNIYGLVSGANQIGLQGDGLEGSPEELMDGIQNGEVKLPFIAHVLNEFGMYHFIVIYEYDNDVFQVADPGKGKCTLTKEEFLKQWTGHIVTFERTADFKTGDRTKGSIRKYFGLLRGQYGKLAGELIISLMIALIGIAGSMVFQLVIDNYGYTAKGEMKYHLSIIFISLIALYLFAAVIRYIRGRLILRVSKKIDVRLMISYFYRVIDLPIEGVRQRLTGEYLSRFSDIEEIRNAISGVATTLVLDTLMVVAAGVILFLENTTMFLTSLIMIFIYAIIVLCFRKPIKTVNRKAMEDNAVVRSYLKESFDGVETIKAFGAEQGIKDKATGKYNAFLDSVEKAQTVTVAQNTLSDATEMVGTVIILWIGFALVIANKMTVGALISFYALLEYFTAPIKNLIELQPQMETAFVAIDRLNDILDQESENINQGEAVMPDMSTWELKDVDFRYGNRELVLHNVSISVSKGQRIALVGESGSGKTTIAKLLLKFYDPEAGKIEVGGKPISDLDARLLRSGIAYVDQNPFFFADTIRNNLMLGNPDATEKEMINACKQAAIHDYVLSLPTGYETPIFENGSDLSGGQRQRLAIARALLRKPQLLIFDEATSNLDSITENAIKESIFNASRDVSCIMIAHRLSTIRQCDKIYVMDKGTVAESGSHEELMDKKGLYYNMWISSQT